MVRSECVCRREKGKGGGDSRSGWRETRRVLFYDRNLFERNTGFVLNIDMPVMMSDSLVVHSSAAGIDNSLICCMK